MGTDFSIESVQLPDESRFPGELTESCELLECLSHGEGIETLLVKNRESGGLYVAKCYRASHPLFSETEPASICALRHSGLPLFIAEYKTDTMRCVLREYVQGEPLSSLPLPMDAAAVRSIGVQLCEILSYLHSQEPPVIHRDIKPQNVIFSQDGRVSLIDFGISRLFDKGAKADTMALGTQAFAPPEQYGFSQTDCRSDIFSLGVLLNYLLTGSTELPKSPRSPMEKLIAKCTAFDPKARYTSAEAVLKGLGRTEPQKRRIRGILMALAAVFILSAAVGGGLWLKNRPSEKASPPATTQAPLKETPPAETAAVSPAQAGDFSEPMMEQAVRAVLGKTQGEPISDSELASITELYMVAGEVFTTSDQFYAAISQWYAQGRSTRGSLETLRDAALLPNLKTIGAAAQQLSDISALAELEKLEKVELKHNSIRDISALVSCEHLFYVGLNDNPVTVLSPLSSCKELRFLDLCAVQNYDPSFLQELGNFDCLDISNSTASYLYLSGKTINELKLCWTGMTSLDCLDTVEGIQTLELNNSAVTDLSPLAKHQTLKYLKISGLSVSDLSVLKKLPNLELVTLSPDMERHMAALGKVSFQVQYE